MAEETEFNCRVQFVNDSDPFSTTSAAYLEPMRPVTFNFRLHEPISEQIGEVIRALRAPHKKDDAALQVYKGSEGGGGEFLTYLDSELTLAEQQDEYDVLKRILGMARRSAGRSGLIAFDIDLDSALNSTPQNTSFSSSASYKNDSPNTSYDSYKSSGSYNIDSSYQPYKSSLKPAKTPSFSDGIDSVYSTIDRSQRALDSLPSIRKPALIDEASAYRPEPLPLIVKPLRGQSRDPPTVPSTTVPTITSVSAPSIVRRRTITEDDPVPMKSGYGTLGRSRPAEEYGSTTKSAYSTPSAVETKPTDYGAYRSRVIADDYSSLGRDYGSGGTLTRSKSWYSSSVDGPPSAGTLPRARKGPDPEPIPFIDEELPTTYRARTVPSVPVSVPTLPQPSRFSKICLVKEDHIVEVGDRKKPEPDYRPVAEPTTIRSWKPLSLEETRSEVAKDVEKHTLERPPKKVEPVKPWSSRV
ncbi:hypothetical protein PENTCL1PPCAC_23334, partial [Pristionchus entomophagus]